MEIVQHLDTLVLPDKKIFRMNTTCIVFETLFLFHQWLDKRKEQCEIKIVSRKLYGAWSVE